MKERILIVEDQPRLRMSIREFLDVVLMKPRPLASLLAHAV